MHPAINSGANPNFLQQQLLDALTQEKVDPRSLDNFDDILQDTQDDAGARQKFTQIDEHHFKVELAEDVRRPQKDSQGQGQSGSDSQGQDQPSSSEASLVEVDNKPLTESGPGDSQLVNHFQAHFVLTPIKADAFLNDLSPTLQKFLEDTVHIIKTRNLDTGQTDTTFKFGNLDLTVTFRSHEEGLEILIRASEEAKDILKDLLDNRAVITERLQKLFPGQEFGLDIAFLSAEEDAGSQSQDEDAEDTASQKDDDADHYEEELGPISA